MSGKTVTVTMTPEDRRLIEASLPLGWEVRGHNILVQDDGKSDSLLAVLPVVCDPLDGSVLSVQVSIRCLDKRNTVMAMAGNYQWHTISRQSVPQSGLLGFSLPAAFADRIEEMIPNEWVRLAGVPLRRIAVATGARVVPWAQWSRLPDDERSTVLGFLVGGLVLTTVAYRDSEDVVVFLKRGRPIARSRLGRGYAPEELVRLAALSAVGPLYKEATR